MPKSQRKRTHKVVVSLNFNKPLTPGQAAKEFANTVHGEHYCGQIFANHSAETFTIRSTRPLRTTDAA